MKPILTLAGFLSLACGALVAQAKLAPPPPGRMIDIGGRELHLNCMGRGSPTVVLESGLGDSSLVWSLVQPKLALTNRVCSYDRSGAAWSHAAGPQHGLSQAAEDLNRLLQASGEAPPFLLVGHSWGGWLITVYAHRYLGRVDGIVLVDSSVGFDPPVIEPMPRSKTGGPAAGPIIVKKNSARDDPYSKLPPVLANAYQWTQSLPRFDDVDDPREPLLTVQAATAGVFPLGGKPLVLIVARRGDGNLGQDSKEGEGIRTRILALSGNSNLMFTNSGHYVPLEDPNTVVDAVRMAIARARPL